MDFVPCVKVHIWVNLGLNAPAPCAFSKFHNFLRLACPSVLITCFTSSTWSELCLANESDSIMLVFERKYKHAEENKNSHEKWRSVRNPPIQLTCLLWKSYFVSLIQTLVMTAMIPVAAELEMAESREAGNNFQNADSRKTLEAVSNDLKTFKEAVLWYYRRVIFNS